MRTYENLEEMISRETDNPTPRAAARVLNDIVPQSATHAVLFKKQKGNGPWVVLFVPGDIPSLAQASRAKANGKRAFACCSVTHQRAE